jgi:hypothetical protein
MSIILSIPNSVHAQSDTEITFDEQICMSIILPHQVQSMSHYPEQLKLSDINSNLETLMHLILNPMMVLFIYL